MEVFGCKGQGEEGADFLWGAKDKGGEDFKKVAEVENG